MESMKYQGGASLVELVVAAPFLLMMGLGTIQMGLMYHAKTTLNYATFEAARVGSVNHAQVEPMQAELAYRLAPVHGGRGSEESAGAAIARAMVDAAHPLFGTVEVINPTSAMFDAWEVEDSITREKQIPNHHLRHQDAGLIKAGVNIHDANLLKIKSEYGYELKIPFAGKMITETLRVLNPAKAHYYSAGRVPLTSTATVRMQNEARRNVSSTPIVAQNTTQQTNFGTNGSAPQQSSNNNSLDASTDPAAECDGNGLGPVSSDFLSAIDPANSSSSAAGGESAAMCEAAPASGLVDGGPQSSSVDPCA